MRNLIAASLLLVLGTGCAGVAPSPAPSSLGPSATLSPSPRSSPSPEPPAGIDIAIKVREALGMRADRAWVGQVQNDPRSVASNLGILVTPEELSQLQRQQASPDDYSALIAYGTRHADEYAGMYLDQPVRTLVMLFTGSLDDHRAAIASLPRGAGVDVRPAIYTEAELNAVMTDLDFDELRSEGIDVITASLDTIGNIVRVEAKAASPDAKTLLEDRYGGKLVATIHPLPGAWSNRGAGNGWQLVANMERGSEWAFSARGATNESEWVALWNELSPGLERPQIDFGTQIAAVFGVGIGGGCNEVRLDDVFIDQAGGMVYPKTSDPLSPRGCDSSLTGAAVFVVALARDALPPVPFKLFWQDPALCPTCDGSAGFTISGD